MQRFMFASIGLLCLSLAVLVGFHVGSRTAHAQASRTIVSTFPGRSHYVMLANGDVYYRSPAKHLNLPGGFHNSVWSPVGYVGNFWEGRHHKADGADGESYIEYNTRD